MKVAVVQLVTRPADPVSNLRAVTGWIEQAARARCDLVVFPEMVDTGYVMESIAASASPWNTGFAPGVLAAARRHGINVVCGSSEVAGGSIFNSVLVADRDGLLAGRYRKVHLFSPGDEQQTCAAGNDIVTCRIDDRSWGIAVCYDLRFPEMWRAMAFTDVSGVVICAAWPFRRLDHWRTLLHARAIENQFYLVAANRVGIDGPSTFCGNSQIIDPFGTVIAAAGVTEPAMAVGDLDFGRIRAVREDLPALADVRPDVYRRGVAGSPR